MTLAKDLADTARADASDFSDGQLQDHARAGG